MNATIKYNDKSITVPFYHLPDIGQMITIYTSDKPTLLEVVEVDADSGVITAKETHEGSDSL